MSRKSPSGKRSSNTSRSSGGRPSDKLKTMLEPWDRMSQAERFLKLLRSPLGALLPEDCLALLKIVDSPFSDGSRISLTVDGDGSKNPSTKR
jgi:hypothetical protein